MSELETIDLKSLVARHRVDDGECFRLADHDPADTGGMEKKHGRELLERSLELGATIAPVSTWDP